jgi:hypothetical protein
MQLDGAKYLGSAHRILIRVPLVGEEVVRLLTSSTH